MCNTLVSYEACMRILPGVKFREIKNAEIYILA